MWSALTKIDTIWKSELSCGLKVGFFQGNGWKDPSVWIDGLDIDTVSRRKVGRGIMQKCWEWWRIWLCGSALQMNLPRISTTIRERSLRFSGHCWRSKNSVVSDFGYMGSEAWQKERWGTGLHICRSVGGRHRGPQGLLAGSDGWQDLLEKESHGVRLRST